jgi:putative toxin-antitoxin system antitoxin component (TIGR02293 family)
MAERRHPEEARDRAEILAKAIRVLGSQYEAEEWLKRPANGLGQRRPVDLLTTPAGVKLVDDYLERLEYGPPLTRLTAPL